MSTDNITAIIGEIRKERDREDVLGSATRRAGSWNGTGITSLCKCK